MIAPVMLRDIAGDPAHWIAPVLPGLGLRLRGASSGYVGLKAPAAGAAIDFTLPGADGASGQAIITNGSGVLSFGSFAATNHNHDASYAAIGHSHDHGVLSGLGDDDHSQYALLAGRAAGQTLIGGTAASETLTLSSTSHGTKGKILFGTSAYDEVNNRLGIGTNSPTAQLTVVGDGATNIGEWKSSGGAIQGYVSSVGDLVFNTTDGVFAAIEYARNATTSAIRIKDSGNTIIQLHGSTGQPTYLNTMVGINKSSSIGAQLHVAASSATTVGQIIQLAATPTANAFEVNSNAGSGGDLFVVTSTGVIRTAQMEVRSSGTAYLKASPSLGYMLSSNRPVAWSTASSNPSSGGLDTYIIRGGAAATIQLGLDDASPVAQTLKSCNGSGTNIAGANLTLAGGQGTGTGAGGSVLIQVAPAGSTGASLNTLVTLITVAQDKTITLADAVNLVVNATTGTKIGTATTQKLGFWNATPVVQPASADQAALTDSTGGTADGTVAAVSGSGDDATINNNFKEVLTLLNQLRADMVSVGLIKGSA